MEMRNRLLNRACRGPILFVNLANFCTLLPLTKCRVIRRALGWLLVSNLCKLTVPACLNRKCTVNGLRKRLVTLPYELGDALVRGTSALTTVKLHAPHDMQYATGNTHGGEADARW